MKGNSLFTINAYREGQLWMFDDESRDIHREPFVLGASEMVQRMVDHKFGDSTLDKCTILFSESFIPEHDVHLSLYERVYPYGFESNDEAESGYYADQLGNTCWLCPAQLKFFDHVADNIFVKII